jgi:GH24 family phage-related lysozyme (muramidase)
MHPSVQSAWFHFISRHEGVIPYMYLDTRQLVTVGVGNLIDPLSLAQELPFQFKAGNRLGVQAGRFATRAEIAAEWQHLKNHPMRAVLAQLGHTRCRAETNLELTVVDRDRLFWSKTASTESELRPRYPGW